MHLVPLRSSLLTESHAVFCLVQIRFEQKGGTSAKRGTGTRRGNVSDVATMAEGSRAVGRLLMAAEGGPELFVSFVSFCSKIRTFTKTFC